MPLAFRLYPGVVFKLRPRKSQVSAGTAALWVADRIDLADTVGNPVFNSLLINILQVLKERDSRSVIAFRGLQRDSNEDRRSAGTPNELKSYQLEAIS
ncbi:hypothetical protein NEOLEDRAFT_1141656 [Neolentinus lepideus HHB14362 ss-1]|uniref:Uncharacterized protein n=1 Tax=Neolentinus lepideus HHB14362 ss-1 TaxID=1314782 RepID=A0A165NKC5_9AGAM|nr:hypothetical protein NEOLEDRAFT_1141656 [Neolentinus lepideus HHB14362 ss-1]